MGEKLVIGIDFGSDSVRTLIVNALTGAELGQSVYPYPRWNEGRYCNPGLNQFRQHPRDYIEGLELTVKGALKKAGPEAGDKITGISIDTTGSTPCAIDKSGTPLALKEEFADDPDAMFILWKDHTAIPEAEEINEHAKTWGGRDFTVYSGSIYSPEWFWAKILHTLRKNEKIRKDAWSWAEHSDWMPFLLTGGKEASEMVRSRCTAGHKAMWHESWKGLPSESFLSSLDPLLSGLRENLYSETYTADTSVGRISAYWADRLGINKQAVVGAGALDAHIGAVGGGIAPAVMVKVMGTSTCDMIIADKHTSANRTIKGISGQVDGSIVPGFTGFEAGQSAFGDVYAWFKSLLAWPIEDKIEEAVKHILPRLDDAAAKIPIDESIVALDWFNGRRTPDNNPRVKSAISGLTLGTTAPKIYRALVEATAFGSKAILERFLNEGISIKTILAVGGVAKKSPFVMQIMADVLNRTILVSESEQTVAIGAAMFASVVSGVHKDIKTAQDAMKPGISTEYRPNPENTVVYERLYKKYLRLGNLMEN